MARTVSIYALLDPRSRTVFYVGKTASKLRARLAGHICDARHFKRCSSGPAIRDILADGHRPIMVPLEIVELGQDCAAEKRWIAQYRAICVLANRTHGGQGQALRTPEWNRRVVESGLASGRRQAGNKSAGERLRGGALSAEHRAAIGRGNTGKTISPERAEQLGARFRGKTLPPAHAAAAGRAWRGKTQSAEHGEQKRRAMAPHRDQQSADQAARWQDPVYRAGQIEARTGRTLSESHKANLGETSKRTWADPEVRARRTEGAAKANTPEKCRRQGASLKARWADPVFREMMLHARSE